MKLNRLYVEKPWGRPTLPLMFNPTLDRRIGEVWFAADRNVPLLAKYLFTSERLSVQVHPDDTQARLRGAASGKAECWYVLDAEPGASIGLGLRSRLTRRELQRAALDGSIVDEIRWRNVRAGDFFYVPPGTIHAIGGGISLLEFQQNSDVTYRLYDYGRPRELHIDDAVAIAELGEYPQQLAQQFDEDDDLTLVDGPTFTFVHSHTDALQDRKRWILPVTGSARCRADIALAGECLLADANEQIETDGGRLFIGAAYSQCEYGRRDRSEP